MQPGERQPCLPPASSLALGPSLASSLVAVGLPATPQRMSLPTRLQRPVGCYWPTWLVCLPTYKGLVGLCRIGASL
jgi:hypothetical protein